MQGIRGVQGILGIPAPINEPMFSREERDRRWARLRELMDADGVELLIVLPESITSDSLYIADTAGVTIFPRDGDPILILGGESSNFAARQRLWIEDSMSATERGSSAVEYGRTTADVLRNRGLVGRRTAIAGLGGDGLSSVRQPDGYAVYTTVRTIAEAVGPEHIVNGTGLLGRARYVKGDEEVARLAASVRLGEASVAAMSATAGVGVPQAEVFGQMLLAQVRAGADALQVAWAPGSWGEARHRYVTTPPGLLERGTYVSTELMPEIRGYQAQVAQPMVIGPPCARAREIFDRNAAAFDAALAVLRPGVLWGDVLAAVEAAAGSGDGTMFPLLHGRGLGNDGPLFVPGLDKSHVPGEPIVANTTFVLKPFLQVPEAPVEFARQYDVTWGDTIVVTDTGARRLGTRKRELIVIDGN
ncbi:M24 family metallopeptidase [Amycolatopsis pithecellobii]|uniref:M24 family metallopeptidase n=1 Tax=Amycolatopsis pithecellobii TaxID=664692 RepID=A0A6N7Z0H2_9PSEU|nr:M24 family metallopeptidase [Amycolatopsis pithecellobii]MTD52944.1 M24 family metallopeptidase [Amycolatopsis pithecellobii]